jgi:hypothetical protein
MERRRKLFNLSLVPTSWDQSHTQAVIFEDKCVVMKVLSVLADSRNRS